MSPSASDPLSVCTCMNCWMACMQCLLALYNWPAQHYKTPPNQLQHVVIKIDVLSSNVTCTTIKRMLWIPTLLIHFHVVFTMTLSQINALNVLWQGLQLCYNVFDMFSVTGPLARWQFVYTVMVFDVLKLIQSPYFEVSPFSITCLIMNEFHWWLCHDVTRDRLCVPQTVFLDKHISHIYAPVKKNHLRNQDKIV